MAAIGPVPAGMQELADRVLDKAEAVVIRHPDWPLVKIPDLLASAYGIEGDRRDALVAGGVLLYAAADVIDDAQDGDLTPEFWGEPPFKRAVNLGNAFLFAALGAFLDAAPDAGTAGLVAWDFSQAGLKMAVGQHLDFDLGLLGPPMSENEYLDCVEGKSGASLGLFCRLAGLCGDRPETEWARLESLGTALGAAVQIRSDVAEVWSGARNRDLGQRTLPILFALALLPEAEVLAMARDSSRQGELVELLDRAGAGGYCELRIESYLRQARADLEVLEMAPDIRAELLAVVEVIRDGKRAAL